MRRPLTIIGAGLALTTLAVAFVIWLVDQHRFEYDEVAHQHAVEEYGWEIDDWPAYSEAIRNACEFDNDRFEQYLLAGDDLGRLQLDIQYTCPDRMDEFTSITGFDPVD